MAGVGGKAVDLMDADWTEYANSRVAVFRCAHCDWSLEGELREGRKQAADHLRAEHGIRPAARKPTKCAKHDCSRLTRSETRMCPEHAAEAVRNAKGRRPNTGRPVMNPALKRFGGYITLTGLNREDLPTWA